MKTILRVSGFVMLGLLLTLFTQVGGVILLAWLPIGHLLKRRFPVIEKKRWTCPLLFAGFYLLLTFALIPPLARMGGRVPLPVIPRGSVKPLNIMTALFNRHYVSPELRQLLLDSATKMGDKHPESVIAYMDANFPFFKGFPLPPHLSHNDGKKVDIALFWQNPQDGKPLHRRAKTFIGYGGSEGPKTGEFNTTQDCESKGYWQYGFINKILPAASDHKVAFDEQRTKDFLIIIASQQKTGKILLEPHLKQRLGLTGYNKIRFHGCHAVRHDDHIHLQL